jgi:threonine/homoserine/homoserine lactone efflux protein
LDVSAADAVRALLLLGMALLAWREWRSIRARMSEQRRRREQGAGTQPGPPPGET